MNHVKQLIIETAYHITKREGFAALTRDGVADEAGIARGAINHQFGTMDELRDAVMQLAIEDGELPIIAHGLSIGHPVARTAPDDIKRQALNTLL